MPQPKKSGSSARKPSARKPSARKPAAGKPAARKPAARTSAARKPATPKNGRKASAGRQAPRPRQAASTPPSDAASREARGREDQLLATAASLRDVLSKGVVITSDRLQEIVDDAVTRGRMTRQDAEELVQNLVAIGRRQAQDALAEIEGLVERSTKETRRHAQARVKGVGSAARRAPGTDRALRTVDRVRRAAGLGHAFPIIGYEELTSAQVEERLGDLSPAELRKVRDHERRNANRKSVLAAIERSLQ